MVLCKRQLFGANPLAECFISPQTNRWEYIWKTHPLGRHELLLTESKGHLLPFAAQRLPLYKPALASKYS